MTSSSRWMPMASVTSKMRWISRIVTSFEHVLTSRGSRVESRADGHARHGRTDASRPPKSRSSRWSAASREEVGGARARARGGAAARPSSATSASAASSASSCSRAWRRPSGARSTTLSSHLDTAARARAAPDGGRRDARARRPRRPAAARPRRPPGAAAVDTLHEALWSAPRTETRCARTSTCGRTTARETDHHLRPPAREAAAVAGGLRERGVRPRRHRRPHAPDRLRLPAAFPGHPARARRSPCPSTRRCASTAWRSTPPPVRDPGRRGREAAGHHRARDARSAALLRPRRAVAARGRHAARSGATRAPRGAPGRPRAATSPSSSTRRAAPAARRACCSPTTTCSPTCRAIGAGARADADRRRGASGCRCTTTWASSAPGSSACTQGCPIAIQSPLAFLARPERWLWTIHERRAHPLRRRPTSPTSCACARSPTRALDGLDLSSWRVALNGAEPVNPETLERFARRFAPYGFRREAMMPVYGLAENSVALCFPPIGRGPRHRRASTAGRSRRAARRAAGAGDDTRAALRSRRPGRCRSTRSASSTTPAARWPSAPSGAWSSAGRR